MAMRKRMMLTLLLVMAATGPASAQDQHRGGIRTETQDRLMQRGDVDDVVWNVIGLFGLLGLLGLRRPHSTDSYHPASLE
jgi:hypothetical protein